MQSTILDGEIVALTRLAYRDFSYCNNGKNARPLRFVLYLFDLLWSDERDITGKRVLQRRDGWNRSSILFPASKLAVTSRIVESIFIGLAKEKGFEAYCQAEDQHLPT